MKRTLALETVKKIGKRVKISGWVNSMRSHRKIIFVDLRDRSGLVQIVFAPSPKPEVYELAQSLRPEWVIEVTGKVEKRPAGMENPKIETGNIEILAEVLKIFSKAKTTPFPIDTEGYEISEEARLRYRYLDLRRGRLQRNLKIRQKVIQFMRDFLQKRDFLEAFEYGVPPHGGIAFGLERFLAVLLGEPNIREVIAFPKTGDSRDLMMEMPSDVTGGQLKELHLKIVKKQPSKK